MNIAGGDTGGGVSRHVRDGISRVIAAGGGMSRHGVTKKTTKNIVLIAPAHLDLRSAFH